MDIKRISIDWKKTGKNVQLLTNDNITLRRNVCGALKLSKGECSGDCVNCKYEMDNFISRPELAQVFNVSESVVFNWENGKTLPDIASLISLSDLYNLSLDELVKGDPKMAEKVKKDVDASEAKTKVIIAVAVVTLIFGIAYTVCRLIGGGAADFVSAAAPWVLMAIGLAGVAAYYGTMEDNGTASKD